MTANNEIIKARFSSQKFSFGMMRELQCICDAFGISRKAASILCSSLRVPLLYISNKAFYQQFALDRALYSLTRWGSTGFAAPKSRYKPKKDSKVLSVVTDDCLKTMDNPTILAEMFFAGGQRDKPAKILADIMKKLKSIDKGENANALDTK
jgi:hypothetical protein